MISIPCRQKKAVRPLLDKARCATRDRLTDATNGHRLALSFNAHNEHERQFRVETNICLSWFMFMQSKIVKIFLLHTCMHACMHACIIEQAVTQQCDVTSHKHKLQLGSACTYREGLHAHKQLMYHLFVISAIRRNACY